MYNRPHFLAHGVEIILSCSASLSQSWAWSNLHHHILHAKRLPKRCFDKLWIHDPNFEDENDTQIRGQKVVSPQWGDNFCDPNSGPTMVTGLGAKNVPRTERGDQTRAVTWPKRQVVASTDNTGSASTEYVDILLWRRSWGWDRGKCRTRIYLAFISKILGIMTKT